MPKKIFWVNFFKTSQTHQRIFVTIRPLVQFAISQFRAGSLNREPTADSTATKKTWIFISFSRITQGITRESPAALIDRCRWFSSDSEVVQESPRESLFKDCYFVSGCGIGSGIAKRFKDPAQVNFWDLTHENVGFFIYMK